MASRRSPPFSTSASTSLVAEAGVEPVDAHGDGLVAPVDVVQRGHDIVARLVLVGRRDGIFEIEAHHIGSTRRRLFEEIGLRAGHEQLGAIKRGPARWRSMAVKLTEISL